MRICIVTVYDGENCGSYWQATALRMVLERMGHSVCYLESSVTHPTHSRVNLLKRLVVKLVISGLSGAASVLTQWRAFEDAQKLIPTVCLKNAVDIDCYIIGSDTIWNLESVHFLKDFDRYTGACFEGARVISYAASAANTPLDTFIRITGGTNPFLCFSNISVRDSYTAEIVEHFMGERPVVVCDPTLLLNAAEYPRTLNRVVQEDYLLLYYFGRFTDLQSEIIKEYAKEKSLIIVSMGGFRKWADVSLPFSPDQFINCFANAKCVLTNTFHGTIFSIIFKKQFVALTDNKIKVVQLLQQLGLQKNRTVDPDHIVPILNMNVDYVQVSSVIDKMRIDSMEYLKNAIADMEGETMC